MTTNDNELLGKIRNIFHCQYCDYTTSVKFNYTVHLKSMKHKNNALTTKNNELLGKISKQYNCIKCDKQFKDRAGLWRHKQKCTTDNNKDNIINLLLTQNKELIDLLKNGITNNSHYTNNTTNNDNKIFNLNLFLNETCKEAMNISDFVSSIQVNLDELENTGRHGYIEGISNIILKRLNNLEQHFRPLHCSDSKREVFYIKDNNEWKKENESKPILTKAIKTIANENIKQIKRWRDKYPDCAQSDSKKNNLYLKIVSNSMNGLTEEEGCKNIDKIISNVAKEVIIDKMKL
jgi:hypothetical protein